MKSKLNATANKGYVELSMGMDPVPLTIEESRALRGELEKAEEEVGRKSAFQEWRTANEYPGEQRIWNAAIDAVFTALFGTLMPGQEERLRALKEPAE